MLSNAGASFARGDATLAGSLPLELSPLRVGPPNQPVSFDVDVIGLDPAIFDAVLGNNTKLGGTINGHLGLIGNDARTGRHRSCFAREGLVRQRSENERRSPAVSARLSVQPYERFDRSVSRALGRAESIQGSGRIEFPNGFEATSGYSFAAKAVAKGAQLNFPLTATARSTPISL